MNKPGSALPVFFAGIAIVSLAAGVWNYTQEEAFFATAEHATATLVRYVPDPDPKAADFCPVFEFTTQAGEDVTYVGDECLSKPDKTRIGRHEEAYYDPDNPQIVESRGWLGSEGSGLILGIAGCVFFLVIGLAPPLLGRLRAARRSGSR